MRTPLSTWPRRAALQERLEREYNLDLITTAPTVVYKCQLTDGTELVINRWD